MQDQWRIAYTFDGPPSNPQKRVLVICVDRYTDRSDPWDELHRLFGVKSPRVGHTKPPCCQDAFTALNPQLLEEFEGRVSDFLIDKHGL